MSDESEARGRAQGHVDLVGVEVEERLGEEQPSEISGKRSAKPAESGARMLSPRSNGAVTPQVPARPRARLLHRHVRVLQQLERPPDAHPVSDAVLGRLHEPRAAAEQLHPERVLQARDAAADAALRLAQRLRGRRDRSEVDHQAEGPQIGHIRVDRFRFGNPAFHCRVIVPLPETT